MRKGKLFSSRAVRSAVINKGRKTVFLLENGMFLHACLNHIIGGGGTEMKPGPVPWS